MLTSIMSQLDQPKTMVGAYRPGHKIRLEMQCKPLDVDHTISLPVNGMPTPVRNLMDKLVALFDGLKGGRVSWNSPNMLENVATCQESSSCGFEAPFSCDSSVSNTNMAPDEMYFLNDYRAWKRAQNSHKEKTIETQTDFDLGLFNLQFMPLSDILALISAATDELRTRNVSDLPNEIKKSANKSSPDYSAFQLDFNNLPKSLDEFFKNLCKKVSKCGVDPLQAVESLGVPVHVSMYDSARQHDKRREEQMYQIVKVSVEEELEERLRAKKQAEEHEKKMRQQQDEDDRIQQQTELLRQQHEKALQLEREQAQKEAEAQRIVEDQARKKLQQDTQKKMEEARQAQMVQETQRLMKENADRELEGQIRRQIEEEIRAKIEKQSRIEMEQIEIEKQTRIEVENEARRRIESHAKLLVEEKAKNLVQEQTKHLVEEQAKHLVEEQAKHLVEEQAKHLIDEQAEKNIKEAKLRMDDQQKRFIEEESKINIEEQAKRSIKEQVKQNVEKEAKKRIEAQVKHLVQEQVKKNVREQAKRLIEEEAKKRILTEANTLKVDERLQRSTSVVRCGMKSPPTSMNCSQPTFTDLMPCNLRRRDSHPPTGRGGLKPALVNVGDASKQYRENILAKMMRNSSDASGSDVSSVLSRSSSRK
eukprot:GHVL01040894.1.p1 GENE.GHVL01040894.1~~GHVL01040894.1.p1  ORF type:complete len:647 (-),score=139.90 GHVL01040894.1:20-1960(-)